MHHSHIAHSIPEDTYGSLSHVAASITPSYPAFPTTLHQHGDSISDHNASGFSVSSPPEHHTLHAHIEHALPLDPILSPEPSRRFHPPSSSAIHHEHEHDFKHDHDFIEPSTPSDPKNVTAPPPIPPNAAPLGQFDMLPPPASTHPSWQALHTYAQTHASTHGYALSINTTAKNRSRIKLACVCYGAPKNTHKLTAETRVRKNRVSYKTGCKMWIEGKKGEDGVWILRVGEGTHNHEGRPSEGWAVQRKRTWGVQGGRVGVGGVTAHEEREQQRLVSLDQGQPSQDDEAPPDESLETPEGSSRTSSHSLESGGLVWKIVEQEMLRKGVASQGRDRGVGRTVKILEDRLPGIHIFKRDVYNIRAQIKRARKAAGQQLGENLALSDEDENPPSDAERSSSSHPALRPPSHAQPPHTPHTHGQQERENFSQIDPSLIAQCNSALENVPRDDEEESEVDRLRRELSNLRNALASRTKEVEEKNAENQSLRVQLELANMALYERGPGSGQ